MGNQHKILSTLTALNWRSRLEEIHKLGLQEIALFPTLILLEDRKNLYKSLEKTKVEVIPFVHLRSDVELWEIEYLIDKYKTKIFNIHSPKEFQIKNKEIIKYKNIITIENTLYPFSEEEINAFGGTCLDISHLENLRLLDNYLFQHNIEIFKKYPPKCNHISAIFKKPYLLTSNRIKKYTYDSHILTSLSELDYLKSYPKNYFSPFIAIELENTIMDQLKVINYVQNLLNNKP